MTLERGINPETGEVGTFVPDNAGYSIQSPAQRDSNRKYFDSLRNPSVGGKNVDFSFIAMEVMDEIISALTTAQCGYLLLLQCYVGYDNGELTNADKTPMKTADMLSALQLGRKRQTFYDFLRKCLEHGIIAENESGNYSVNPRYHFRGVTRNRAVIRSYTAKVKQVYREVKAADLGLIYRMLPFVHYGTNALCDNPLEQNPKEIRWFNGAELAAAIGIDNRELYKRLPRMKFGDEFVVAKLSVGGDGPRFIFNPNVFYRKNSRPDDTLVAMFNVNNKPARRGRR